MTSGHRKVKKEKEKRGARNDNFQCFSFEEERHSKKCLS